MTIENRELAPGTKLEGTHKKATYICEVVEIPGGGSRYMLEDGRLFSSPSAAGKAVMNGISCNGWRFWSLAGEARVAIKAPSRPATVEKTSTAKPKLQIKKLPNQKNVPEGQMRWFCSACMKSFLMPTGQDPAACPEGHSCEMPEEPATD